MSLKQRQLQLIQTRLQTDPNYKPSKRDQRILDEAKKNSLKIEQ